MKKKIYQEEDEVSCVRITIYVPLEQPEFVLHFQQRTRSYSYILTTDQLKLHIYPAVRVHTSP